MSIISTKSKLFIIIIFVITMSILLTSIVIIEYDKNEIDNNDNIGNISENKVEKEFYEVYRQHRIDKDLSLLNKSDNIKKIAEYKSERMVEYDYFAHTSPDGETLKDRFKKFDNNCTVFSENIAKTQYKTKLRVNYTLGTVNYTNSEELAEGILKSYISSQPHKENLNRDDWKRHAIDVVITDDNTVYHTHNFCK